jgi:mercuric ion binding protein
MNHLIKFFCLSLLSVSAFAAPQTATLSVPGMTCAACPITIKKALSRVDGVERVEVSYKSKTATVLFDDQQTSPESLTQATTDAGYPSTVQGDK